MGALRSQRRPPAEQGSQGSLPSMGFPTQHGVTPPLPHAVPFMPLPSSWKVLRLPICSSVCSLPEEATLLWGDRGAWSPGMKACRAHSSSGLIHSPGACGLVGMRDMERLSGLGWIWQGRAGKGRQRINMTTSGLDLLSYRPTREDERRVERSHTYTSGQQMPHGLALRKSFLARLLLSTFRIQPQNGPCPPSEAPPEPLEQNSLHGYGAFHPRLLMQLRSRSQDPSPGSGLLQGMQRIDSTTENQTHTYRGELT